MDEKLFAVKAALTACLTGLGSALGWKGFMAAFWVLAMFLDYISGTAAACKEGTWSSATARQGLWHKGGMILVVIVAVIADCVIRMVGQNLPDMFAFSWPGLLFPLVMVWYIITEAGSILENAVKLGTQVPDWLVRVLKISLKAVDKAGDAAANSTEQKEE